MNPNLSEIVYILDRSGSMQSLQQAAIDGFNEFLQGQLDTPGDANLSLLLFDNEFDKIYDRTPLQEVRDLDSTTYQPRASTSLLDAIGHTITGLGKQLEAEPEEKRPGKVIVAIYTDGYENSSREFTLKQINQMITHQRNAYAWEFLFLAANQDAMATAAQMGIAQHMASSVQLNEKGMRDSTASMSRKLKAMRSINRTFEEEADYLKSMSEIVSEEEAKE
jgi:hypothetical protein